MQEQITITQRQQPDGGPNRMGGSSAQKSRPENIFQASQNRRGSENRASQHHSARYACTHRIYAPYVLMYHDMHSGPVTRGATSPPPDPREHRRARLSSGDGVVNQGSGIADMSTPYLSPTSIYASQRDTALEESVKTLASQVGQLTEVVNENAAQLAMLASLVTQRSPVAGTMVVASAPGHGRNAAVSARGGRAGVGGNIGRGKVVDLEKVIAVGALSALTDNQKLARAALIVSHGEDTITAETNVCCRTLWPRRSGISPASRLRQLRGLHMILSNGATTMRPEHHTTTSTSHLG